MADNFNLRQFLTENKLTKNAKLLAEAVTLDGKSVDVGSIEIEDIDTADYPDFSDAYITYAEFEDGTPLSEDELMRLEDENYGLTNELIHDRQMYMEGKKKQAMQEEVEGDGWKYFDIDGDEVEGLYMDTVDGVKIYSMTDSSVADTASYVLEDPDGYVETVHIDVSGQPVSSEDLQNEYELSSNIADFIENDIAQELGLNEWSPYGSIAFYGKDKPKEREPKEGEVELSTLNKGDVFKLADGKGIEFRVWGDDPRGGVYVQYTNYDEPRPNYTMRGTTKVIKLDAKKKETVKESTLSPREKYLTRLVENALGLEGYGDDNVNRQREKQGLPPAQGPKYSEGISEEEMVQEKPIPSYKSIEELMKEIDHGTNEAACKYKMEEMKRIAQALEEKVSSLEEGEGADFVDSKKVKQMKKDIMTLRKQAEKLEKEYDKKFGEKKSKKEEN